MGPKSSDWCPWRRGEDWDGVTWNRTLETHGKRPWDSWGRDGRGAAIGPGRPNITWSFWKQRRGKGGFLRRHQHRTRLPLRRTRWLGELTALPLLGKRAACSAAQSCLTLCNRMGCSPPGSSVHRIPQAGVPEWVAISSYRASSRSQGSPVYPTWHVGSLPLGHLGSPS